MLLTELLAAIGEVKALQFREAEVSSVVTDSRRATEGAVFCALVGEKVDGTDFIEDAARHGAVAAITERAELTTPLVQLVVPDARAAMRKAAWALWAPSVRQVKLIGVTGTNGKTTTATLLRDMLNAAGRKAGLLTTIGCDLGFGAEPTGFTTPETAEILGAIDQMRRAEMSWAVIEVSSHALALGRVDGLSFEEAVFTNLTTEHLDFHGTMEAYLDAKALLFEGLSNEAVAVLNREDAAWKDLSRRSKGRVVTCGTHAENDVSVSVAETRLDDAYPNRRTLLLARGKDRIDFSWSLAGVHNLQNLACAAGAALEAGVGLEDIARAAQSFRGVAGRLEAVDNTIGVRVLVDYAHTPDALETVLRSLRTDTRRRLICLFGCGGDRDRTKRPLMGEIVSRCADAAIVTSDNPRSERPAAIIDEILAGMPDRAKVLVEEDRAEAIRAAIEMAEDGDTLLLAGKGHETCQIIGKTRLPFSDVEVAARAISARTTRNQNDNDAVER